MDFVKKNFNNLLVALLVLIVLLQKCDTNNNKQELKPTVTTTTDTAWKQAPAPVINVYPQPSTVIPYVQQGKPLDPVYIPDTNYYNLKAQFESLRDSLLSMNVYNQEYKQDSSSINIIDTIFKNKLQGRSYKFNLKYPIITNTTTITEPYKPVSQVYIGGNINGAKENLINSVNAGFILKTKKDQIYQVTTGLNTQGQIQYGLGVYWKIKLK